MLMTIGKVSVFITTLMSVIGLGLALWAWSDPIENYSVRDKELRAEISKFDQTKLQELASLRDTVNAIETTKVRPVIGIPGYDNPKSVADLEKENQTLIQESQTVLGDVQRKQQEYLTLVNELEELRKKFTGQKEIAKDLRLKIEPDAEMVRQGFISFRNQMDQATTDKLESEKRIEGLQAPLYETGIYLQLIQERTLELLSRDQALNNPGK